ncbi:MAG: dephospho-CoA kinase [Chloroflexota bacterium]|nr:dephospho-CoA kinase [Chloroflexota bacterium]
MTERGHRSVRIGLTGPIGCGKSTVAGWLAEVGAMVVDADDVARDVTAPGEPAVAEIAARFGGELVRADGSLDRAALARIVFADESLLRELEAIVHPALRPRLLAAVEAAEESGVAIVAIEAIKLVEGGLAALCDEVWVVACDPRDQRARLAGRGVEESDAERRIDAQGSIVDRLRPVATRVIETSGGPEEARARVLEAAREAVSRRA